MRAYRVNKFKHEVYDSIDEIPSNITPLKDWRVAEVGDWVIADDECIIQVLRKGKMLRKKSYQYYIGTCTGTFPVSKNTKMDTDRRPNIYSFSGYGSPEEVVANRRKMTANEELFVQYVASGIQPEEAYVKAFPTNNKRYAKMKAANLVKTERIKTAMKEELKPILEEMGVDESFVLKGIKAEAEMADKSGDRLKALFKLADIFDMEDKNATKVQQITGVQFQGFTDEMIEPAERKKLLMANINLHNVSKEEEALQLAKNDLIAFGKLFLPDDFLRSETPPFHYEIADVITDMGKKQVAVILPRGHGKTVMTKCDILKAFCFAKDPLFYGWVSATAKLATGNMDYIKYHVEFNERIQYYFGNLKGTKWTETDVELSNGCKLISKSNISGIRGGAKLHKRYDLIILDDFEDENNTITPEARSKNSNLITAVVFPALEPGTGRLRINGTPVHYDSFINNLIVNYQQANKENKEFSWDLVLKKAIMDDGTMLWDSWFGAKEMERKKKFYADSGQPQKFYQEYMMEVQSEDDAMFNRNHIRYWDGHYTYDEESEIGYIIPDDGDAQPCNVFVGVDPATDSQRRDADYSVLMIVAVDLNNNVYVLEYIRKRGIPVLGIPGEEKKGIVDYMFQVSKQYHPHLFVVEDTAMSKPVFQALRAEMRRRNDFSVRFKEEKPGTRLSKRDRIQEVLAQRFAIGQIHLKKEMYDLHREIITFGPRMAHDDTIDALAYACKFAQPPIGIKENKDNNYYKHKPKAKSWVVA